MRENIRGNPLLLRIAALAAFVLFPAVSRCDDSPSTAQGAAEPAVEEAAPSRADESGAASLEPIVIEADKTTENALVERSFDVPDDVSGFGETIFAEPTWRSFKTTAELLGESVGAQIHRQGGQDDFSTLTIRGAPAAQVRILLDGVALGRASDSVVNLADLPVDTIDRIEVYRGFAPVALTPVSAAGIVNIVTRDPDHATGSMAVGGGSFGTAKINGGGAGPLVGGNAAAFASYRHTEGDYDYVEENDLDNKHDDTVQKLPNNDSDTIENLLRWRRNVTDATRLQLRNQLFYKEEGVPFFYNTSSPKAEDARLKTVREIAAAGLGDTDGRWNAEQIVSWESQKLTHFVGNNNTSETTASTTSARWGRPLGKSNWFSGSSEYTWEGFDQQTEAPPSQQANRSSLAIAAGDDWTIAPLDTTVSMQLRHQELWNHSDSALASDSNDHSTDPHFGLRWEPVAGLAIKSNVSTYFRPPSFDELYGSNGFTKGNPTLKPETGLAWDAGFEWTAERDPYGKLSLGYSWFGSNIDDVIVVTLTFDRQAKAKNESSARIRGHEVRAEWKGPAGFALSANYTHQDTENRASSDFLHGNELAGLSPNVGWARLSWTRGLLVLAYELDVTGAHYPDSENLSSMKLPTRTVHSVSTVFGPFWKGWRLTFEANNLGNSLVPDQIGYPLPGRAFYGVVSWSAQTDTENSNAN